MADLFDVPIAQIPEIGGDAAHEGAFILGDEAIVGESLAFSLAQVADEVSGALVPALMDVCGDESCARSLLAGFAGRAFRRPLAEEQLGALVTVYEHGDAHEEGVALAIATVLQSPSFLHRLEIGEGEEGGARRLNSHEVAGRLASLILGSVPDKELRVAADAGRLGTVAEVSAQVDRLLATPRGQESLRRFLLGWFDVSHVLEAEKDEATFPGFDETLRQSLYTSAERFVEDVVGEGRPLATLITSNELYTDATLDARYGFGASPGEGELAVVEAPGRDAGLLTHPATLAALAKTDDTSVVHRGLFVRHALVCGTPLPAPPAEVLADPEVQATLESLETEQELTEFRLTNDGCRSCHEQIDRYGLLLEDFDGEGAFRDGAETAQRVPLAGELVAIEGPRAFVERIVADGTFDRCAVVHALSFAAGQHVADACAVDATLSAFEETDRTIADLFRVVAESPYLDVRRGEP